MTKQHITFTALIILHLIGLAGCSCKTKAQENIAKPEFTLPAAQMESVMGVVAVYENGSAVQVVIEVKPDSRSKITYEIAGARKDDLASLKGKRVTVTGMVRNLSPFHKIIDVTTIDKQ